jgi:hypothetical protein
MTTKTITINIYFRYTHPVYGDVFEAWVDGGHHESCIAAGREKIIAFIAEIRSKWEDGKWFTQAPDGQKTPTWFSVRVDWHGREPDRQEVERTALDVQFLIIKAGGMATKSRVEDYLMAHFGIDRYPAHQIMNDIEFRNLCPFIFSNGVFWNQADMLRPEPTLEMYPTLEDGGWMQKW